MYLTYRLACTLALFFTVIAKGQEEIDTISITINKPIWVGVLPGSSVTQLVRSGGIGITETVARRTGVFGERHTLSLKNGVVGKKKEVSYTLKIPDVFSNVKISTNIYRGVGESMSVVNVIDSEITINIVGILKESMASCISTGDNEVMINVLDRIFNTEGLLIQTVYKALTPYVKPCMRRETYNPKLSDNSDQTTVWNELRGDLNEAHLHYLLHSLFIGGGGSVPARSSTGNNMGHTVITERLERTVGGKEVPITPVGQRRIDRLMEYLNSEADARWYKGITEESVSCDTTQLSSIAMGGTVNTIRPARVPSDKYRDDLLSTNCNARVVRIEVHTSKINSMPGVIISVPNLDHAILIFDNSMGEEVGDENKVDVGTGARLAGLSRRRRSSSTGDLPNFIPSIYNHPRPTSKGRSIAHVYETLNFDSVRRAKSEGDVENDTDVGLLPDYHCNPIKFSNSRNDKDDDDDYVEMRPVYRQNIESSR